MNFLFISKLLQPTILSIHTCTSIKYFTTQFVILISKHPKPSQLLILVSISKSQHIEEPTSALFLVNSIVTREGHCIPEMLPPPADDKVYQALKASCAAITNPDSSANPLKSLPFHIGTELHHKKKRSCLLAHHVRQILRH